MTSEGRRYEGFLPGRHGIDAYGNGGFRFAEMSHRGSMLALPSGMKAWAATDGRALTRADLADVLAEAAMIELLLVGTGEDLVPLSEPLRWSLREAGIAFEVMPTGAAARTYNVLLAEGRRVAAALIAVA
ncbi:MTH938/NDUFAF3 family protein [Chelatococcus sp. SYSU_G07232]|uniref:MTH938/NDUFAF3 family protein n=1 Tax=Chelatococcus albus TaxID=3047466 RepID=A0ABT7ACM2_9HYPH|nr:MTH938/NDUFAF3 family protein [Chelatococcus sp. SYSU_G07232]MDJ1157122.1 MTH938/NDUFAF3 family protein [Chelatococcus sp. SYSU_G07232]